VAVGDPVSQAPVGRLSGALDEARESGFVGRRIELTSFAEAMSGSCAARVLFVHGPGGIGKTTLLDAFARRARLAGTWARYVDARDLECSVAGVRAATGARDRRAGEAVGAAEPPVLLVDGYELLAPLDRWFREELLPSRPSGSVTVLAGRAAPAPGWSLDPGWSRLVRVHELHHLGATDSAALLERLGVESGREVLAELGHGHPLALAMLAEAYRTGHAPTALTDAPDVVSALCGAIVDDVPDAAHRTGLATCAHATRMTEDLLARMVGARAGEVWRWLESRPYVRRGEVGLFLHDVVRELFEAEFAQRAPQAYTALHRAVRGYFLERVVDPADPHHDRAAAEILLLHRRSPLPTDVDRLRAGGVLSVPNATPQDHAEVVALVERYEGPDVACLAARWIEQQPRALYLLRTDTGIIAFAHHIYLPAPPDLVADDPVCLAVLEQVDRLGPLRPGERINVARFSGAVGDYRREPAVMMVDGVSSIIEWSNEAAAWTFIVGDRDHFGPYFEYLGLTHLVDVPQGPDLVSVYGWDRRRFSVDSFFELMARRELSGETGPAPADLLGAAPLPLDDFAAAVRNALRALDRPDELARSPLVGSALVPRESTDPAASLRQCVLDAVDGLSTERRGAEHHRVLERSYVKGAPSQEAAAELLGLPFSTYRRHLAQATDRLVEVLWAREIGQPVSSD
jgi:hypothetical protein